MRVSFFRSLPVRLAGLILLLSGVTLAVLTELNRRAVERLLLEQAEVQAALATTAVADGLDAVTGGVERLARLVARDVARRMPTAAEAEQIARNLVLESPQVWGCSLALEPAAPGGARLGVAVNRSGVAAQFAAIDLTAAGQEFWTRDWYREVLDKGQPVWSEPFVDRGGTDRAVVRVAVPVLRESDREPVGAVAAIIDLDWLQRLANTHDFADTSFAIVFSRSGRIVIHPKPTYAIVETVETLAEKENTPDLAAIRQAVLAKRQGHVRYLEPIPQRRVHANYKPAKAAGWGVIVGFDEAEFLKTQRAFRRLTAVFAVSLLAALAGIVILVTHLALRPLGALATAAGEIAKKNLDCAVPPARRDDEVGRLTEAFRAMRDALKAQHLERRWADQSLQHQLHYSRQIIHAMSELVFVLTKSLNVSRVNPAALRAIGAEEKDAINAPLGRFLQPLPGAKDAPSLQALAAALKEGRSLDDVPVEIAGPGGAPRAGRLTLSPLRDGNRLVGGVAIVRLTPPA